MKFVHWKILFMVWCRYSYNGAVKQIKKECFFSPELEISIFLCIFCVNHGFFFVLRDIQYLERKEKIGKPVIFEYFFRIC